MKKRSLNAFLCVVLAFGSIGGVVMRPEEIEELMDTMNRPTIAHTLPDDLETGDDLIRKLLEQARPDS